MPSRFYVQPADLSGSFNRGVAESQTIKAKQDDIALNPLRKRAMELGISQQEQNLEAQGQQLDAGKRAEAAAEMQGYMQVATQGGIFNPEAFSNALMQGADRALGAGDREKAANLSKFALDPEGSAQMFNQVIAQGVAGGDIQVPTAEGASGGGKTGKIQEYEMYAADQKARGLEVLSFNDWDAGIGTAVEKAKELEKVKSDARKLQRAEDVLAAKEPNTPEWYKAQEEMRKAQEAVNEAKDREAAEKASAAAAESARETSQKYAGVIFEDINRAVDFIDNSPSLSTGFIGALSKAVPGTPAFQLNELLEPLRAGVAFKRLSEMRAESPTGGALGQVSEIELKLLGSVMGSFEQGMGAEALRFNLKRAQDMYALIAHGDSSGETLREDEVNQIQEEQRKSILLPDQYSSDVSKEQWDALDLEQRKAFIEAGK